MKVCVSYSDTHRPFLYDFFIDTFPFEEGVSLVIEKLPQKCDSGKLFSKGWRDQMIQKQIFINKNLTNSKEGEIVVFCDVDIRFYGNIRDDLEENLKNCDICFLKDHNSDTVGRCGGFFALKVSPRTRKLFKEVQGKLLRFKEERVSFQTSEQSTINELLEVHKEISWKYLPEKYYTHGLYTVGIENFSEKNQSGLWWENKNVNEKRNIYVPDDILVHHANWCNGVDNKLHLLKWVEGKINFRRGKGEAKRKPKK